MCLGGGGGGASRELTDAEKNSQKLAYGELQTREQFLPYLFKQAGYQLGPDHQVTQLPPTPEQQMMQALGRQGLAGGGEAGDMMLSRLRMAQGMLPGLLSSVQASMSPGTRTWQAPPAPVSSGGPSFQELLQSIGAAGGSPTGSTPSAQTPGIAAPGGPAPAPAQTGGLTPEELAALRNLLNAPPPWQPTGANN